jgi:putative lysine transport system substrate-binding protein
MKKRLSILAAVLLTLAMILSGCGSKKDDGIFKVGMECGYAPFNWTQTDDSNGAVPIEGSKEFAGGYDVEIAKRIAEGLGQKLVVVKTEWDGLPQGVKSGTIDAIVAGMSPTADRKLTLDFSQNYYKSNLVMVVKKGGQYENAASIQDFKGAKITAQLNTFHYTVIDQIQGVSKQPAMDDFPYPMRAHGLPDGLRGMLRRGPIPCGQRVGGAAPAKSQHLAYPA